MRHPTDPPAPWRAAATLGRLLAQGLLDPAEAAAALAAALAPGADASGWAARRAWRLAAARDGWARARHRALLAARQALPPLLAARAPRAVLEATLADCDPHHALTAAERRRLLRHAVTTALTGRGR
jgi:hypothetical protein